MSPKPAKPLKPISGGPKSKPTPKPKVPLPLPERLKRLFTSLCAQIDGGHFGNAIKTCDKILALSPGDKDALQTKLFLLLQTDSYLPSLTLISSSLPSKNYEKAYALYRLNRESEAREVLASLTQSGEADERGIQHLEAQLAYRLGEYEKAYEIYNSLLDTADPGSEEHSDILTNLHASQTHLEFISSSFTRALLPSPPADPPSLPSAPLPPSVPTQSPQEKENEGKKKKVKLPKGVVLGVTPPPDPERWLKKSERTSTQHGRKKRGGGGGATQGSSVSEEKEKVQAGGGGGKGKGRKKK